MLLKNIIYFLSIICLSNSARILGVFQMPSYSHYQLGHMLLKELANKGHEVTLISPHEEKEKVKNLKTIVISNPRKNFQERNLFDLANINMISDIYVVNSIMLRISENTLNDTNVQKLIKSNSKFDVVIVERLFNEVFHGFCAHFKAHCIILSPQPTSVWINNQMGNSGSPAYVPKIYSRYSSKMNFFERVHNFLGYIISTAWFHFYVLPKQNAVAQKYFPNIPHLSDFYYNVSLTLLNSHVSVNPAVPLLPNMVEIGGYHVKPPKELPTSLRNYLDNAKEGVIYFNMGSNLKSEELSVLKRDVILKAFGGLKESVLWKWENESLPNQPPNVKLAKWIPQNDLLAHPNVKLFITHGGLLSNLEAIYHGVPIIGIPVFGDQYTNMKNAVNNGYGISVPYAELDDQSFENALKEVLQNPKYLESAQLRSKVMHDNQMKPLDRAVFWIEYVLRHNGAPHMKCAALHLTWYQYLLLDVITFIALLIVIPICACFYMCRRCKTVKSSKVTKIKKKQ